MLPHLVFLVLDHYMAFLPQGKGVREVLISADFSGDAHNQKINLPLLLKEKRRPVRRLSSRFQ
jgi:hypothetical protein